MALERREFDTALSYFATALEAATTGPGRALVHNKRALTYLQLGDASATVAALVDALWADPRCVPAIVNVGNLLLEDAVLDDAVAHFEAALRIDEAYAAGHFNLGIAYKRLGRQADAVRAFRRADRIEAGFRPPRSRRV
jgi:tetratricopeptide (TPR) repeat protein